MKRYWILALLIGSGSVVAQDGPPAFEIEVAKAPARESIVLGGSAAGTEQWERYWGQTMVRNVTQPSVYPVLPDADKRNGKAIVVVPGGGYRFVSMDSEGFRVADALAAAGYAAFIVKYRPMQTPVPPEEYMAQLAASFGTLGKGELEDHPPAVDDLAAAVRLVHENAAKWNVNPDQIGVIGFSAGARTLIRLIEQRAEMALVDNVALIYPPMTQTVTGGPRPPLFLAIAVDDPLFTQGGLNLVQRWLDESAALEFHLYSGGSHGFGMRTIGTTSDHWIDHYRAWLALQ